MADTSRSFVSLVGAGPGDPGLLTLRGRDLLALADVVVYDALANPRLLSHCKPGAETIYVGKRAASHAMTQDAINALLVEKGKSGKRVVRLKGGDPFVFGRGGEECEALAKAGVPFEVVPGITAAIAAPAYAGIPVTHRDLNSSFTLVTGHEKEEAYKDDESKRRGSAAGSSDVDWSSLAKLPCLAFYMGVKSLGRICENLIASGMNPATPAATIHCGTTASQRTVVGTIADLPQRVAAEKITPPALTIVGQVVKLRETINWFESRPLFGQTIVVTRTRQQASELSAKLEALGANVIEAPTIEIGESSDHVAIEQALAGDTAWDWVVFTSASGVTFTKQKLLAMGLDVRVFGAARIAAIGDATARAVRDEMGLRVDLIPERFVGEALADELKARDEIRGKKFLLLRADIARPILRERLHVDGAAEVRDVSIYETRPATALPPELVDAIDAKRIDWITFTSSSTATNFTSLLGQDYRAKLAGVKIASIGPITTSTLRELGLEPAMQAETFNVDGVVQSICGTGASSVS